MFKLSDEIHLPLSSIDQLNQPPSYYLWVQDGLSICMGLLWTSTYLLYLREGVRDRTYGMPIIALCCNFGWEFIYGLFYPLSFVETVSFKFWLLTDLGLIYITLKYGPGEWLKFPFIGQNIPIILFLGCSAAIVIHWAFIVQCSTQDDAALWSGFCCQTLLGISSVAQLLSRDSTRGHSWMIWLCRSSGSLAPLLMFIWRYWHYPQSYPLVSHPLMAFLFGSFLTADVIYAFTFSSIRQREYLLLEVKED